MTPLAITPQVQMDLYAYTAAVINARREYADHPTAACQGTDWRAGERSACLHLAVTDAEFCAHHLRHQRKAAEQMRAVRARRRRVQRAADQQRYRDRKAGK